MLALPCSLALSHHHKSHNFTRLQDGPPPPPPQPPTPPRQVQPGPLDAGRDAAAPHRPEPIRQRLGRPQRLRRQQVSYYLFICVCCHPVPVCGSERYARDTGGGERTQQDTDGSVTLPFTFCAIVVVVIVVAVAVVVVDTYACMYDTSTCRRYAVHAMCQCRTMREVLECKVLHELHEASIRIRTDAI